MRICQSLLAATLFASAIGAAQNGLNYSRILPFLGSPSAVTAMTSDSAGNVFLAGWTEQPVLPVTPGVVQPKFAGGSCTSASNGPNPTPPSVFTCPDAFVINLDASGKIVFATYLGGPGFDQATSIALDGSGNIYVAGITTGYPTAAGSKFAGGATFIVKLNPSATKLLYTASIPGTGALPFLMPFGPNTPPGGVTMHMTVDSAGNAYFAAGATSGFPITQNAIEATGGGAVGKLDPSGQKLIYATYLDARPGGVTLDAAGSLYITGTTSSTSFPLTKGVLQSSLTPGTSPAFVAKLNQTGALDYATYLGGSSFASGQVIRVDSSGNAYVLGSINSAGFPVTPGAYQATYNPNGSSAFLAKINSDATALVYATFVDAHSVPPSLLDVDASGNAYIGGQAGPGFAASPDAIQPCRAGGADAFVLQLTPNGKFEAATYLGGSGEDLAYSLESAPDGTVLLAGLTTTPDFLVTHDSPLAAPGPFVAKFRITDPADANLLCSILAPENLANFQDGPVAPGELVTFWGLRFGPETGAHQRLDSSGRIAAELAGVRVFFDDLPAPIFYAQSVQINTQVPWELAGQTSAKVRVEYNGVSTRTGIVTLQPSAPALFPSKTGATQGSILNHDGSRNSASNPAAAGSVVSIFGTGGGPTNPPGVTGGFASLKPLAHLTLPASVILDGAVSADVLYAGAAPTLSSGRFQINFRVPASLPPGAAHRVDVKIGSASTAGLISVTVATK